MSMFLLVLVVTSVAVVSMSTATSGAAKSARTAKYRTEARALAMATAESFFAKMVMPQAGQPFATALKETGSSFNARKAFHPAWTSPSEPGATWNGRSLQVTSSGAVNALPGWEACRAIATGDSAITQSCSRVSVTSLIGGSAADVRVLLITVDVSVGCQGSLALCVDASYQMRVRQPMFQDYLYFNDRSMIDPDLMVTSPGDPDYSLCSGVTDAFKTTLTQCRDLVPAYRSVDNVNGPLYVNDSAILVCPKLDPATNITNFPRFTRVEVAKSGNERWYSANEYRNDLGCVAKSASSVNGPVVSPMDVLIFPTEADISSGIDSLVARATAAGVVTTLAPGAVINMNGDDFQIVEGGAPKSPVQYNRIKGNVLYAPLGDITVNGSPACAVAPATREFCSVTIIAKGNINIGGDIPTDVAPTSRNAVSLVSIDQSIVIPQNPQVARINAVLVSLKKSVYVADWSDSTKKTATIDPVLKINGTVAGHYQGAFGGYNSSDQSLVSGYIKDFKWDSRSSNSDLATDMYQWLPKPSNASNNSWTRLDLTEVRTCTVGLTRIKNC